MSGDGVQSELGPREGVVDGYVAMLMPRRRCGDEDARYATAAAAVSVMVASVAMRLA